MKKIIIVFILYTLYSILHTPVYAAEDRFFEIQSLDTMKYSRDAAANDGVTKQISQLVGSLAERGATHIAIGTPYDEEFYPVMKKWVTEIRRQGMKVWFRGNFAAWEGWFGYERFVDPFDHLALTSQFITNHPDLFEDGDIFTPAPEPENGGFGDPRQGGDIQQKFFSFLPRSYQVCKNAFDSLGRDVRCGYFSVNGDVARLFTSEMVTQTGGVLVIDHYVGTAKELAEDIRAYHDQVNAPIVLGEYGAPIPDIHGELTQEEQAKLIGENLKELAKINNMVQGINYWTAYGGSTALFQGDNKTSRLALQEVVRYFKPHVITGAILDEYGNPIPEVEIQAASIPAVYSQLNGTYQFPIVDEVKVLTLRKNGFKTDRVRVPEIDGKGMITLNVRMSHADKSFFDYIRQFFILLFSKLSS